MSGTGSGRFVGLLLCAAGIYTAYLYQGYLQERITTSKYEPGEVRLPHLGMLHGLQSFVCFFAAGLVNLFLSFGGRKAKRGQKSTPLLEYLKPALTNTVGPALGILALKNIPYSSQVLVKSCKLVPVMVMGTIFGKKRYSLKEYLCVALICVGLVVFSMKKSSAANKKLMEPNLLLGYSLCMVNLAFDGFTNAYQDKINSTYKSTSSLDMMCWMNFWTGSMLCAYMFGFSTVGMELVSFLVSHPKSLLDVLAFCLCGALGQLFIFLTINKFGALTLTLVTTTRKFFSILISSVFLGSTLVGQQWVGIGLLFAGLLWNMQIKNSKHSKVRSKAK
ncbi:UDP galactose transporter [Chloropicon primus]|uniref:UDP galactose transporter n=1 Tax=Chloropicon primus TaxID=1764295 RepID=A0A5B8MRW5_9CHLO|nr:UDP galactose transporter [Chloropicon primus]UPR02365.1 UDP galactose transporter [Chloropicon primus]|mmetsp:Transcript_5494/g.16705  ORF Transcript_5494/g.16705 Transcript_5494/m.16705 type:complete len:333 (-) Transcript_5494:168-1166(-)|eukprot:QDZ23151.1 UDP galactose transporter [Chloropicon primus]